MPNNVTGFGEMGRADLLVGLDAQQRVPTVEHLGDAEVRNLHPARFVEQDVLRLDVAVDNAFGVGVCSASQIFGTIVSACAEGILPACNTDAGSGRPRIPSAGNAGQASRWPVLFQRETG